MTSSSREKGLALIEGRIVEPIKAPQYPRFSQTAIDRVTELLSAGRTVGLSTQTPEIAEAERAISVFHGGRRCLTTSSGHGALQSALAGLEIGPGDEVITTPYTWGASTSCILHQNAIPIFADVDHITGLLDPMSIEERITSRTKAILVVHIFGQPADMTAITRIAATHGLSVVEDGSQAHGARWDGELVGNFGDAAGFSCMGGKILATIEAGYMITRHDDVFWRASLIGQHMGRLLEPDFPVDLRPYTDSLVYTFRANPITAVLLTEQLKKLNAENAARKKNMKFLRQAMHESQFVRFPEYPPQSDPVFHMATMNFDFEGADLSRDTFIKAVNAEGIPIGHYVPSPIPDWKRMNWQEYEGPKTAWGENLKRYEVDYRATEIPNCRRKIDHSLELSLINTLVEPDKELMEKIANSVLKVENGISALRDYEQRQQSQ